MRVSVWWDFENCNLPQGANGFKVAHSITAAVRGSGIKGPVQITAFGDMAQLSRTNQEAMSATGITLTHVPNGGKNSADRSLLVDLMYWVSQNPPPAHLFLISGDRDFATVLHRLRMSNYNILLAGPVSAPGVLCSAASIVWQWNALVKEENITGKYFNQPPDGPYGSWYGHYNVPLENPFEVTEQTPSPRLEEVPESNQDPKPRLVPKVVLKQVRSVLCTHPKGISITDLRSELRRYHIDKDFYGYKKFSHFLLSMPHILKLQSGPDGQLFVHSTNPKWAASSEPTQGLTTGPVAINKEPKSVSTQVSNSEGLDAKSSLHNSPEHNVKPYEDIKKSSSTNTMEGNIKPNEKIEKPSSPSATKINVTANENLKKTLSTSTIEVNIIPNEKTEKPLSPSAIKSSDKRDTRIEKDDEVERMDQHSCNIEIGNSTSDVGIFGRTWRQWLYGMDGSTGVETSTVERTVNNVKVDESSLSSTSQTKGAVENSSKFSSANDDLADEKISGVNVADYNKDSGDVSVFKRMVDRCMFWRRTPVIEKSSAQPVENLESEKVKHELFSKESFWKELEAFLDTPPNGSVLVLHSMSREQMAHNLQKNGPLALRRLSQSDLLQLVDLLINDKRWVEESLSQAYPFKLVLPPKSSSSPSASPNRSALRSAFSDMPSPSITESFPQDQNPSTTGVSPSITDKKARGSSKSRNDILSDCQKLVDDIVKENPGGFNLGCFRKRFIDTYGYPLDVQKLGYQKLVTVLQIMPGVVVRSSLIYPSGNLPPDPEIASFVGENDPKHVSAKSDSELSDPPNQDDELDSAWDELGPVAGVGSKQNEVGDQKSAKVANAIRLNREYETLDDDYISDSEDDTSGMTGSDLPGKARANQEDSSLLRILDSWYSTKEDTKEGLENEDDVVHSFEKESSKASSNSFGGGNLVLKTESPFVRCGSKTKSTRRYSFVSEQNGNNKEKLIDGILGSLKKSGESRVHG